MADIKVDIDGESRQYSYDEITDGYPVLNVGTDEVGILDPSFYEEMEKETARMEKFIPFMGCILKQEEDEAREQSRLFRTHAVILTYKEFLEAADDATSDQIVNNLADKVEEKERQLKDKEAFYASVIAKGYDISSDVHAEILKVRGKDALAGARMVRVRSEKIKNHCRWFHRDQVKRQLGNENRENNKKVDGGTIKTAELNFFKKEIWNEDGGLVPAIEDFNKQCNNAFFTDNPVLDTSVSAQFLRYSTEAVAESKAVWNKDEIDVKIGAKADASFSAAAAQGRFTIQVPDENGFGLMQFLKKEVPNFIQEEYTEIFMKVVLVTEGNAFVGACASVSTDLGLSCSQDDKKPEAKAQAGVELFVGAKAQAEASFAVDVMFVEDTQLEEMREATRTVGERGDEMVSAKDIKEKGLSNWRELGKLSAGFYVAAGFGAEATFAFGYFDNHFRFQAKIGATVKLGMGSSLKGTIAPKLVGRFILTIANGFNWKLISDRLDKKAQLLYHTILSNCFYLNEKVDVVYGQFQKNIGKVMDIITNLDGFDRHGLEMFKIVDDKLDEILPGYSSYKQNSMAFIITKAAYRKYKELKAKNKAIYTVLDAKNDRTRWNYATWQMKVNLIYDMRSDITDLVDAYTDEQRGEAVLAVLKSARHAEEFKKIVKGLEKPEETVGRDRVILKELLTTGQSSEFDELKRRFN